MESRPRAGPPRPVAIALAAALLLEACTGDHWGPGGPPPPTEDSPASTDAPTAGPIEPALVDPDEIRPGGPPPDGIPPIDEPSFLAPHDVDFLDPDEPVIAVEIAGAAKAYPLRILIWHEIVNDRLGGVPIAVTYCPLCNSALTFERPVVDGELLDFGTSGKLYRSNLVMYDRQTGSYWTQATGQAVVGPLLGTQLELVPTRVLSWRDWRLAFPDGSVLSTDTGHDRDYGRNPYGGYDTGDAPLQFDGEPDPRLPVFERVIGVVSERTVVAFPFSELSARAVSGWSAVNARVGRRPVVVFWTTGTVSALDAASIPDSRVVGSAAAYHPVVDGRRLRFAPAGGGIVDRRTGSRWTIDGRSVDGPLRGRRLEPAVAIEAFWFTWASFYPDTEIFGSSG